MSPNTFTLIGIALVAMIYHVAGDCIYMPDHVIEAHEDCRKNYMAQHLFGYNPGCMSACVFEKLNFMVDEKLVAQNIEDFFNEIVTDSDLAERMNDRVRFAVMRANIRPEKCDRALVFIHQNTREEREMPLLNQIFC